LKPTTATQNGRVQLSSTDANVPLLAIEAANELDELIEGRTTTLESVARLVEVLKQSFRLDASEARRSFVDSGTVAVFSQAIDESSVGHGVSTVPELVQQATEIVKTLETSAKDKRAKGLETMRDFCIALANASTAYQQSIFEMRPSNPLRS
jgi:hypothetical protein